MRGPVAAQKLGQRPLMTVSDLAHQDEVRILVRQRHATPFSRLGRRRPSLARDGQEIGRLVEDENCRNHHGMLRKSPHEPIIGSIGP